MDCPLMCNGTLYQRRTPHPCPLPSEGERENRSQSKSCCIALRSSLHCFALLPEAGDWSNPADKNVGVEEERNVPATLNKGWGEEVFSHAGSRGGRLQTAFTLIELMVVIALIGILSAMIIPEMRGTYEEALLRSTSRQLVNLCNLAYSRAVSMQQLHRIVLDPVTGKFMLEKRDARSMQGKNFVPTDDVSGSRGELDTRISIRFHRRTEDVPDNASPDTVVPAASDSSDLGGRVVIGFYPDGTADPGEIQLRDRQGFGLLLRISPVTSRVRVIELPRE